MNESGLVRAKLFTIPINTALSNAINIEENGLVALVMPTGWDAAVITFQASESESGVYQNVYDATGTELTVTTAASRHVVLSPQAFAGVRFLKLRSGTSGTPVNQTAARDIVPLARRLA